MADTYFLIDQDNNIVNCILWDGVAYSPSTPQGWLCPAGLTAVKTEDGHWCDGWKWDGQKSYDPNPPPPEPQVVIDTSGEVGPTVL